VTSDTKYINCSLGLLLGMAKKLLDNGLKPLLYQHNNKLLLSAEFVLVV
jgi:hypothetical protein